MKTFRHYNGKTDLIAKVDDSGSGVRIDLESVDKSTSKSRHVSTWNVPTLEAAIDSLESIASFDEIEKHEEVSSKTAGKSFVTSRRKFRYAERLALIDEDKDDDDEEFLPWA